MNVAITVNTHNKNFFIDNALDIYTSHQAEEKIIIFTGIEEGAV